MTLGTAATIILIAGAIIFVMMWRIARAAETRIQTMFSEAMSRPLHPTWHDIETEHRALIAAERGDA